MRQLILLWICCIACNNAVLQTQPEQVHLSLGVNPSQMVVTWVTLDPTSTPKVEYGSRRLEFTAEGNTTKFVDDGSEKRVLYIHRVTLVHLTPGESYNYHCGSDNGWSDIFWFTAIKDSNDWTVKFAVYGDLGNINGRSIPRLQEQAQRNNFDAILHVGDFAYNMESDNGRVGDSFMKQIEPIAAYVPYMTAVGNHESAYNFSNYVNRFTMIDSNTGEMNNHFYSFNIGPAHIISFSTEFYFYVEYGWAQIANQFKWLEEDLIEATKPENRKLRPWIITMGHRPMYCSTDDSDDCTHKESIIRKGLPVVHAYGLEDLFYKYGVDLEFWAHEHVYERLWPVYDRKVFNGSIGEPYTNPKAPVHIITGSAGCQEDTDAFVPNPAPWSAIRSSDYGFSRMIIHNHTHLYLEQISDVQEGKVIDDMMIIKNVHGQYQ